MKGCKATRAKVVHVNLIYGSHFSATKDIYKVSQNVGNFDMLQITNVSVYATFPLSNQ